MFLTLYESLCLLLVMSDMHGQTFSLFLPLLQFPSFIHTQKRNPQTHQMVNNINLTVLNVCLYCNYEIKVSDKQQISFYIHDYEDQW